MKYARILTEMILLNFIYIAISWIMTKEDIHDIINDMSCVPGYWHSDIAIMEFPNVL